MNKNNKPKITAFGSHLLAGSISDHDAIAVARLKAAGAITVLDTVIALVACMIMFSIIFSSPEVREFVENAGPDSTVGMLFLTLPTVFYTQMAGGTILGPVFFILVGFAALSSTISMLEVPVSTVVDKTGWERRKALGVVVAIVAVLASLCSLSLGASSAISGFNPFFGATEGFFGELNRILFVGKSGFMDLFDKITANWFLPVGGFGIAFFTGWFIPKDLFAKELHLVDANGTPLPIATALQWTLRVVAPLAILIVIVSTNFV